MKRFRFEFTEGVRRYCVIEATSREEAIEKLEEYESYSEDYGRLYSIGASDEFDVEEIEE